MSRTSTSSTTGTSSSTIPYGSNEAGFPLLWHAFLSHSQRTGGTKVLALSEGLRAFARIRDVRIKLWMDVDEEATGDGMVRGIEYSTYYVVFITPDIFERPAVQYEVAAALRLSKPIIVIVEKQDNGISVSTFAEAISNGRHFSANPLSQSAGLVSLQAEDFDTLEEKVKATATFFYFYANYEKLMNDTIPLLLSTLTTTVGPRLSLGETDSFITPRSGTSTITAVDGNYNGNIPVEAPYRMRRPLHRKLDLLIVTAPNGVHQGNFLRAAFTHLCARRQLVCGTLDIGVPPSFDPSVPLSDTLATSYSENESLVSLLQSIPQTVANVSVIVCVLTATMWRCKAVEIALQTALDLNLRIALVHETDARYGGARFDEILEYTPSTIKRLFSDTIAERLERKLKLREAFFSWLLPFVGAEASDAVGGTCPPPALPLNFNSVPIAVSIQRTVDSLLQPIRSSILPSTSSNNMSTTATTLDNNLGRLPTGTHIVAAGGMGGAGKTTLASAIAYDERIRKAYDDIFWITIGQTDRSTILEKQCKLITELEACEETNTTYPKPSSIASIDTVEMATKRLRTLLVTRKCLIIIDDVWDSDHFLAFFGIITPSVSTETEALITSRATSSLPSDATTAAINGSRMLFTTRRLHIYNQAVRMMSGTTTDSSSIGSSLQFTTIEMGPLPTDTAIVMLAEAAGISNPSRLNFEPLLQVIKTLPLSLCIAGACVRMQLEPLSTPDIVSEEEALAETVLALASTSLDTLQENGNDNPSIDNNTHGTQSAYVAMHGLWLRAASFRSKLAARNSGWYEYMSSYRAIALTIARLFAPAEALNFGALGLLPDDTFVHEEVIAAMWRRDIYLTRALIQRLSAAGLVKVEMTYSGTNDNNPISTSTGMGISSHGGAKVMLHDLAADFAGALCAVQPGGMPAWHANLLSRFAKFLSPTGEPRNLDQPSLLRWWWRLPNGSPLSMYINHYIICHLAAAGLHHEARLLILSLPWLQSVINTRSVSRLLNDFEQYIFPFTTGALESIALRSLYQCLRLSVPALVGTTSASNSSTGLNPGDALPSQLLGRIPLDNVPQELASLLFEAQRWRPTNGAVIQPIMASLAGPGGDTYAVLQGHTKAVQCVIESSGIEYDTNAKSSLFNAKLFRGKRSRVASGGWDCMVRIWDAETGACERVLEGHTSGILCLTELPNGLVVSGSADHTARLWNISTGIAEAVLKGHTSKVSTVIAIGLSKLATGSWDTTIRIWESNTGICLHIFEGHTDWIRSFVTFPAQSTDYLLSSSWDGKLRLWNIDDGFCEQVYQGHTSGVWSTTILHRLSTGNVYIASGSRDSTVRIYDMKNGSTKTILTGHTKTVIAIAALPDDRYLATGSQDYTVRLWNIESVTTDSTPSTEINIPSIDILRGHTADIQSILPYNGYLLATGSHDKTIRIWNLRHLYDLPRLESGVEISVQTSLTLGQTATPVTPCIYVLRGHTGKIYDIIHLTDTRLLSASQDGTLRIWNDTTSDIIPNTPREKHDSETTTQLSRSSSLSFHTEGISVIYVIKNGTGIISGSFDTTLRKWSTKGKCILIFTGHTGVIRAIEQLPFRMVEENEKIRYLDTASFDHGDIVSSSWDKTIRIWDIFTGQCKRILQGHTDKVEALVISPSGQIMSTSTDATLRVWLPSTGQCTHILRGHTGHIFYLAMLSPVLGTSGTNNIEESEKEWTLVSAGGGDYILRVWKVPNTLPSTAVTHPDQSEIEIQATHELKGHIDNLTGMILLSPERILTCSWDRTARLWDLRNNKLLHTCDADSKGVFGLAGLREDFRTTDVSSTTIKLSKLFVTGGVNGIGRIWDSETGECIGILPGDGGPIHVICAIDGGKRIATAGPMASVSVWEPVITSLSNTAPESSNVHGSKVTHIGNTNPNRANSSTKKKMGHSTTTSHGSSGNSTKSNEPVMTWKLVTRFFIGSPIRHMQQLVTVPSVSASIAPTEIVNSLSVTTDENINSPILIVGSNDGRLHFLKIMDANSQV